MSFPFSTCCSSVCLPVWPTVRAVRDWDRHALLSSCCRHAWWSIVESHGEMHIMVRISFVLSENRNAKIQKEGKRWKTIREERSQITAMPPQVTQVSQFPQSLNQQTKERVYQNLFARSKTSIGLSAKNQNHHTKQNTTESTTTLPTKHSKAKQSKKSKRS